MRDPARVAPFLEVVREFWELYPDLRFGQVMRLFQATSKADDLDPFELEEKDWKKFIRSITVKPG